MIEGIETVYQQIADSIDESIHEPWSVAWMEGVFFTEHTSYSAEYQPQAGGPPKSFASGRNGRRAFERLRELFKNAGKPLWCRARFELHSNGKFNMNWNYEDCDQNGFARFDEQAELE